MNFQIQIIPYEQTKRLYALKDPQQPNDNRKYAQNSIKPKKNKIRKSRKRQIRNYWNLTEQTRYLQFLKQNIQLCQSNHYQRRIKKINLKMSQAIQTREKTQCHSHHQKMLKKYKSLPKIITSLSHKLEQLQSKDQSTNKVKSLLQTHTKSQSSQQLPQDQQMQSVTHFIALAASLEPSSAKNEKK